MKDVRFLYDADTGLPHIAGHHVTEAEVLQILYRARQAMAARDQARQIIGQTDAGRYLKVIFAEDDRGIFVITAFEPGRKTVQAFKRRQRRK